MTRALGMASGHLHRLSWIGFPGQNLTTSTIPVLRFESPRVLYPPRSQRCWAHIDHNWRQIKEKKRDVRRLLAKRRSVGSNEFTYGLHAYLDSRQQVRDIMKDLVGTRHRVGDKSTALYLKSWLSDDVLKSKELMQVYRTCNVYLADPGKMMKILHQDVQLPQYPFEDAIDRNHNLISMMKCEGNPDSLVSSSLQYGSSSLHKFMACQKKLCAKFSTVVTHYASQNANPFLWEYHYMRLMFQRYISLMNDLSRRFHPVKNLEEEIIRQKTGRNIVSRDMWPQEVKNLGAALEHVQILTGQILTNFHEYYACLGERLCYYMEMSKKHPEDIPIMKQRMICPERLKPLSQSDFEIIRKDISYQLKLLKEFDERLLLLERYLEDPKNAPHSRASFIRYLKSTALHSGKPTKGHATMAKPAKTAIAEKVPPSKL